MTTTFKNFLKNIFVDVEGTQIPVSQPSQKLNSIVPEGNIARSFRTVADMESGKFRRMFDRHKVAFGY